MAETMFEKLANLDVNDKLETRDNGKTQLKYLSWSYAWSEFKKYYPTATYNIRNFVSENNTLVPYMYDENTGYMVMTDVTADDITYTMWLPVMDSNNRAMKKDPYTIVTSKGKEFSVASATMFDINKTIMRCLVKNLAMFGLGLYIYAGEDLPEKMDAITPETKAEKTTDIKKAIEEAQTAEEVSAIYKENTKLITSNVVLLDMITKKGKKLKGLE